MTAGWWDRTWYAPASLARLGAFRIGILVLALYGVISYAAAYVFMDARAVTTGEGLREWRPIYLFEVLQVSPIGIGTAEVVYAVVLVAIAMGILGVFTRLSCAVAAIGWVYWIGLAYSFGKPHHDKVALTFAILALPFVPVGARLSVDSLVRRWRRAAKAEDPTVVPRTSDWAGTAIRVTQVSIAFGYCFAGSSKLGMGGWSWINGYTLQGIMMGHDNSWSAFFAQNRFACQFMSVGLVLSQFTFPLVFWLPWTRWFYLPAVTTMHVMTWQTMDTGSYVTLWGTLIAFVSLEKVPGWVKTHTARAGLTAWVVAAFLTAVVGFVGFVLFEVLPLWMTVFAVPVVSLLVLSAWRRGEVAVVFDGGCGICRRALAVLDAMDWCGHVDKLNLMEFEAVRARFPALDLEACTADLHLVDARGRVRVGFEAYRALAWRLPLIAPLAPLLYLPPVGWLGRGVYRRVADGRSRDGCGQGICSVRSTKGRDSSLDRPRS